MSLILKALKKYNDDTFILSEHPITDIDLESKVIYFHGLGLVMASDDEFNESERRFVGTLLRTLDLPDELLSEIEKNSQSIDVDFIDDLKKVLSNNNIVSAFFYDAIMICHQDGNYCKTEREVIKQLSYLLDFSDEKISFIERVIEAVNSKDKDVVSTIDGECYWSWSHLVEYMRSDYTPQAIKVSNYQDFKDLLEQEIFSNTIKLGKGRFWISESDSQKLLSASIIGEGIGETEIILEGEEVDEDDHTHELFINMMNIRSFSNCTISTAHRKLQVTKFAGDGNLFNNCELEDISERDFRL